MTRPPFFAALAALIVNDLVLKSRFPGLITGKLSDVAGLFAFVVFFAALVPRWRWHIGGATALAFVWWKSPLSQPVIDALHLHRTVDATDLVALIVIPLACAYAGEQRVTLRPATVLIAAVSLLAFANSFHGQSCCAGDYLVPYQNEAALIDALSRAGIYRETRDNERVLRSVQMRRPLCPQSYPTADIELVPAESGMILRVLTVRYYCPGLKDTARAQTALEREIIEPLGGRPITSTPPALSGPRPASAGPFGAPPPG